LGLEIVGSKAKKEKKKEKEPSHAKEIYPEIMKYSEIAFWYFILSL
jgi:hypothetical protein